MGDFSATELLAAFEAHLKQVEQIRARHDWEQFAMRFTPDVEYVEHAFGTFHGREEVAAWAAKTMGVFPGRVMTEFPPAWVVADPPTSRIICELRNLMPDPGDGSALEVSNITILTYAGDGLWSRAEDIYNPRHFAVMATDWARRAHAAGNLPDDAAPFVSET